MSRQVLHQRLILANYLRVARREILRTIMSWGRTVTAEVGVCNELKSVERDKLFLVLY